MLKEQKKDVNKNISKINYKKYFENKKITLMGLGGFSRSIIEAEFLAKNGADLIITDLTLEKDLKKELEILKKYKNIKYTLGEHRECDFKNRDIVFSANGVPLGNKYIEIAKKYSKLLTKTAPYVFYILQKEKKENNFDIRTLGVTGTKGKSTTTSLIVNLLNKYLEEKNKKNNSENKVFVGGNVRGTANLTILPEIKSGDFFVAELDS
jgi:UDP-N-acetylmuramoylalanine--D-glutamate ligase